MGMQRSRKLSIAAFAVAVVVGLAGIAGPAMAAPPPGKGKGKSAASAAQVSGVSVVADDADYVVLGTVANSSKADITISDASADGWTVGLYNGAASVGQLVVPASGSLALTAGGYHIRLSDAPDPLPASVTITLTFSDDSTLEFTASVPAPPPPPPTPVADDVEVSGASVVADGSDYGVLGTVSNSSDTAATISSASADGWTVGLYNGTAAVGQLVIPASGSLALTAGGYHIKLSNAPDPLPADVTITLTFSDGSALEFTASVPAPPPPPGDTYPDVMAAAGDSINVAYNSSGSGEQPQYSWATGSSATVASHWRQLQALSTDTVTAHNFAQVGATSAELGAQVASAASVGADYLVIEIGANDACTPSVSTMTPVSTFSDRISAALNAYATARPDGEVFIASIPNLYRMWEVSRGNFLARWIWSLGSVCQSMLANPNSTSDTNEARRQLVQARVDAYNAAIKTACENTPRCTYDGGAVAAYQFERAHVSSIDYFHPSVAGQAVLASITWKHSPFAPEP